MLILREILPKKGRWNSWTAWLILACLCSIRQDEAVGQPAPAPANAAATAPVPHPDSPLKAIGPDLLEVGLVRIDTKQRTITFPALVNLREGNLEYLLVTTAGKTHESLLRTEARPHHIQVALLLLGAKGAGTNSWPEDPNRSLPGHKVRIDLSWPEGRKLRRFHAEDFVQNRRAAARMKRGPWIFTGSRVREDGFAAELDGSIVSLITDRDALINNPQPGREDDDNWLVRPKGLPPLGAAVSVSIALEMEK